MARSKAILLVNLSKLINNLKSSEERDRVDKAVEQLPEEFRSGFRDLADRLKTDVDFLAFWETDETCQRLFRELTQPRIDKMEQIIANLKELIA